MSVNPHPGTASVQSLGIDTSTFISPATASMTLTRVNSTNSVSIIPSATSSNITYNFATGYTFTLICNAFAGYTFANPNVGSITSISGGGTYTINSSSFTSGNTQITMNVTITGVPFGTTNLQYALVLPVVASAPKITNNPGNPYKIIGTAMNPQAGVETGNAGGGVSIPVTVTNNTGGTVYIWVGVENFTTGGTAGPNVNVTGGYQSSPTFNLQVLATPNTTNWSATYRTLPNGQSITATLYRIAPLPGQQNDAYHTIRLWWANNPSAPTTSRQPIAI